MAVNADCKNYYCIMQNKKKTNNNSRQFVSGLFNWTFNLPWMTMGEGGRTACPRRLKWWRFSSALAQRCMSLAETEHDNNFWPTTLYLAQESFPVSREIGGNLMIRWPITFQRGSLLSIGLSPVPFHGSHVIGWLSRLYSCLSDSLYTVRVLHMYDCETSDLILDSK